METHKIYFVYLENMKVLDDYIESLGFIHKCVELGDINDYYNLNDIFIFGQMWLDIEYNPQLINNPNFMFLNVEMLTDKKRLKHIKPFLYNNINVIDYSLCNIDIMKHIIANENIPYTGKLIYLPYQYNPKEVAILKNDDGIYEYDVGIINAVTTKAPSNNHFKHRRTEFWNKINTETDWKCINILGWGKERDELIKKCKIIINIHNFDFFTIFEHIRCDRLIFANKIVVSDKSYKTNLLDIEPYVYWEDYDNIIPKTQALLNMFDKVTNWPPKYDLSNIINNRKHFVKL